MEIGVPALSKFRAEALSDASLILDIALLVGDIKKFPRCAGTEGEVVLDRPEFPTAIAAEIL